MNMNNKKLHFWGKLGRRSVGTTCLIAFFLFFLVANLKPQTSMTEFVVNESTLNKILRAIGDVWGTDGTYSVGVWALKLKGTVKYKLYNNYCDISESSFKIKGKIRISWRDLSYSDSYSASASLSYDNSQRKLKLRISSVDIRIRFMKITFGNYTVRIPFDMGLPITGFRLSVRNVNEILRNIKVYPAGVRISRHSGYIKFKLDPRFRDE